MAARPEDVDIAASAARGSFPPEDRRGFVYRACFFLGAGILFPWNSYITAVDYFERVHPGKHVDRVFGVLYFLPNLLVLALVLRFGNLVPPGVRVRLGFCLFLLCLLVPAFTTNLAILCAGIALNGAGDVVRAAALDWTQPLPEAISAHAWDVVLAADCVFWPELFEPLLSTMGALVAAADGFTAVALTAGACLYIRKLNVR